MVQQLKKYTALAENASFVPSSHMEQLTTPKIYLPGIQVPFLILKHSSLLTCTQIHTCTQLKSNFSQMSQGDIIFYLEK